MGACGERWCSHTIMLWVPPCGVVLCARWCCSALRNVSTESGIARPGVGATQLWDLSGLKLIATLPCVRPCDRVRRVQTAQACSAHDVRHRTQREMSIEDCA